MSAVVVSGKRKRAVARAKIKEGSGKVIINSKNYETLQLFDKLRIQEPLKIAEAVLGKINFDVEIIVKGGGEKGQIEAARLALATDQQNRLDLILLEVQSPEREERFRVAS